MLKYKLIGTFWSKDEDDYEYEFSVLSMRTSKNVGLQTLRWFPSFALRIPTAHDFCVISARKGARACKT